MAIPHKQYLEHPGRSVETDGLDEYGGDFRDFTAPDDRLIADILHRRKQMQSLQDQQKENTAPSTKVFETTSTDNDYLPPVPPADERPQFVHHHADSCTHVRSKLAVCGSCIDSCPQKALDVVDGTIRIDHAACVGCGVCTVICPSGAMRDRHTPAQDLLATVQGRLADARLINPTTAPTVVFHQSVTDKMTADRFQVASDHPVLSVTIAQIGSVGPEVWLGALAYGAAIVTIQIPETCPVQLRTALAAQHEWVAAMLSGMGLSPDRIQLSVTGTSEVTPAGAAAFTGPLADFSPFQSKRMLIRRSIVHLANNARIMEMDVPLPMGAPFGSITVEGGACTLCMVCAGACPTQALSAAEDQPDLKIVESECVQCGRCRSVCPEKAITLQPRMLLGLAKSRHPKSLCAQEPFACISCGKGFAPSGLVEKMIQRLDGHWMYRREEERRRLGMCPDCRVRDVILDHEIQDRL